MFPIPTPPFSDRIARLDTGIRVGWHIDGVFATANITYSNVWFTEPCYHIDQMRDTRMVVTDTKPNFKLDMGSIVDIPFQCVSLLGGGLVSNFNIRPGDYVDCVIDERQVVNVKVIDTSLFDDLAPQHVAVVIPSITSEDDSYVKHVHYKSIRRVRVKPFDFEYTIATPAGLTIARPDPSPQPEVNAGFEGHS